MSRLSRRQFVAGAAGLGLLAGCGRLPWQAPEPVRLRRVGYLQLGGATDPELLARLETFRQGLHELGYAEGQHFLMETRFAEGSEARLPTLAAELIQSGVEVVVTSGEAALSATEQASETVPIVVASIGALVETGHAASLARPGGLVTGLTDMSPTLSAKRLELLRDTMPGMARIAVLWNPGNVAKQVDFSYTQAAAEVLGLTLQSLAIREPADLDGAFDAAETERASALLILNDALVTDLTQRIAALVVRGRLPAIHVLPGFVAAGGLMSYGPNISEMFHRAAVYVDKILRGTRSSDLPIEQPMTFGFAVNLKTAQALGITFPNEIMLQVTEVVQ